MGSRKRISAENRRQAKKQHVWVSLQNLSTSPRKMRLVADLIRGMEVEKALGILKYNKKQASNPLEKLIWSGLANWQLKSEGRAVEEAQLYIKEISVDGARMLKRLHPAPQGRGHRIRKRSNHVRINIASRKED